EALLVDIGEARGRRRAAPAQADALEQDPRRPAGILAPAADMTEHAAGDHVFLDIERGEDAPQPEGARDAAPRDVVGGPAADRLAGETDLPRARAKRARDQIEHRGLAAAIGTDKAQQFAILDPEGDVVDGDEAAEGLADMLDTEQGAAHSGTFPAAA